MPGGIAVIQRLLLGSGGELLPFIELAAEVRQGWDPEVTFRVQRGTL